MQMGCEPDGCDALSSARKGVSGKTTDARRMPGEGVTSAGRVHPSVNPKQDTYLSSGLTGSTWAVLSPSLTDLRKPAIALPRSEPRPRRRLVPNSMTTIRRMIRSCQMLIPIILLTSIASNAVNDPRDRCVRFRTWIHACRGAACLPPAVAPHGRSLRSAAPVRHAVLQQGADMQHHD